MVFGQNLKILTSAKNITIIPGNTDLLTQDDTYIVDITENSSHIKNNKGHYFMFKVCSWNPSPTCCPSNGKKLSFLARLLPDSSS